VTSQAVVVPAGAGEVIADAPERRVELLCDHDALHVTWSRLGPLRDGADLHVHRQHTDLFYVLAGELTLRLGPRGEAEAMAAGTLARVPPNVVHGFRNGSQAEVEYLNVHAPGCGFAAYMRGLRDGRDVRYDQHPPPDGGGSSPAGVAIGVTEAVVDRPASRLTILARVDEIIVADVHADAGAPPGTKLAPGQRVEALYVLDGELTIADVGPRRPVRTGAWVTVPAGLRHMLVHSGDDPVRYLQLSARVPEQAAAHAV
jgi:quercetin dioxygenase-like cupin family protein